MLSIKNVDTYYGEVQALHNVSLEIQKDEIIAIIGSNGAGKTTLMKSIMGLVKPRHGTIEFCGERLDGLSGWDVVKKGVIYIPEGREVFPDMTVLENLEMGAYSKKYSVKELRKKLEHAYELFPRLKERNWQLAGTLSGGEQQMLAVGRGLMSRPKVLMMDEPSLGLAPLVVQGIFDIIREINRQGVTILLIEQNANMALKIADLAYVLETGTITMSGTGAELLADEKVKEAYLGKKRGK